MGLSDDDLCEIFDYAMILAEEHSGALTWPVQCSPAKITKQLIWTAAHIRKKNGGRVELGRIAIHRLRLFGLRKPEELVRFFSVLLMAKASQHGIVPPADGVAPDEWVRSAEKALRVATTPLRRRKQKEQGDQ